MKYLILFPIALTALAIPRGMPYDYFVVLRLVNFAVFGFLSYAVRKRDETWMVILGGLALLFNPFVPIHLGKAVWTALDIATILVGGVFFLKSKSLFQSQ